VEGQVLEVFAPKLEIDFGEGIIPEGNRLKVDNQQTTGEVLFNRSAGWLESSALEQKMTLLIHVGEQEIKQTMDQQVELKRLSAKSAEPPKATEQR
ncbi:MAG: hypothetical protein MI725_05570, partial [Pirellulales bacterium]|nr:hypothetical protein [Pirellulales bacterium]